MLNSFPCQPLFHVGTYSSQAGCHPLSPHVGRRSSFTVYLSSSYTISNPLNLPRRPVFSSKLYTRLTIPTNHFSRRLGRSTPRSQNLRSADGCHLTYRYPQSLRSTKRFESLKSKRSTSSKTEKFKQLAKTNRRQTKLRLSPWIERGFEKMIRQGTFTRVERLFILGCMPKNQGPPGQQNKSFLHFT